MSDISGSYGLGFDLESVFNAAQTANSDPEFAMVRDAGTVTSNAIDSMQPITSGGSAWSDFWRGASSALPGLLNYAVQRDGNRTAAQIRADEARAAAMAQYGAAGAPAQAGMSMGPLVLIGGGLLLVGVLVVALKK